MRFDNQCSQCAYFYPDGEGRPTCEAFPGGIPDEILRDGFDHTQEFPGDNGYRFNPS